MLSNLQNYHIILGSSSPRRIELLKNLGLNFEVKKIKVDETVPPEIKAKDAARYLSEKKASSYSVESNTLVITADTIVVQDDMLFGKPKDRNHAIEILNKLSGNSHHVITAITLCTENNSKTFEVYTQVHFTELSYEEITYYVDKYKPYDKAGAYGIQEWIGYIGITGIEGSYYNVMGLPIQELYQELKKI